MPACFFSVPLRRLTPSISLAFAAALMVPPFPEASADDSFARQVAARANLDRGLCAVLGPDPALALDLARAAEWLVHVRHPDPAVVEAIRQAAANNHLPIQRLTAEHAPLDALPHATNTLDLLLAPNATPALLQSLSPAEILRALRPQGLALLRAPVPGPDAARLQTWAKDSGAAHVESWSGEDGTWLQFKKPPLEGAGDWSHWEKSPDNNPVSTDPHIKAPYMTQFMAEPYYIGMPAITTAAGGRTFLAMGHIAHHEREWGMLNRLIARNGYNGIVLWERKLPDEYLVHRSAFVATDDTFHMIDGDRCLMLDAATGAEKGRLAIPGLFGEWKWLAIHDGILYALAGRPEPGVEIVRGDRAFGGWSWADLSRGYYGKRIPHGFGDTLAAYDLAAEKTLWTHKEDSLIDSRGLAIRDGKFFLYCPDKHFRALDCTTGEVAWTNAEGLTLELIEQPGKGLTSTPGWRTQSMVVATPESLVVQGQTRMNVIGISTDDGSMLWQKSKVTNNPNAIYVDGKVILGVGERGEHIVIDPLTGTVEDSLNFFKRACTRLTASTDSFFVRGEGMTRFDRDSKKVTVDGAVRPACNDGVIPANGLIYLGPWACDCNLSLIGNVARCSAGDFRFDYTATDSERLQISATLEPDEPLQLSDSDWPTYRANSARSASTRAEVAPRLAQHWIAEPALAHVPSEATAAAGLVFTAGENGRVRALDARTGTEQWAYQAPGVVKYPPTIGGGRAYFGCGDGYAYCLEATTGRLLWRFRASPVERHIMLYGTLSSTWPVNTGILVHDGIAYFAAGIVDHDGTYVYALDADTGAVKWQNNTSGHLNPELRKGVSAQGNLTIAGDRLFLAGGNVVSPATFDLTTGECLEQPPSGGQPQANGGKFVGVFHDDTIVAGGRILYASPRNVSTKGSFTVWNADRDQLAFNYGGIPPAWNDANLAVANYKFGNLTALDTQTVADRIRKGFEDAANPRNRYRRNLVNTMTSRAEHRWQSAPEGVAEFEPLSVALAPNAVLTVARYQDVNRARRRFALLGFTIADGRSLFRLDLPREPLPGGLIVDRDGRIIVTLLDGTLVAFGPQA